MTLALSYTDVNSLMRIARCSPRLCNKRMETIDDIRHRNLLTLIQEAGSQAALADRLGVQPSMISQWVTRAPNSATGEPRVVGGPSARKLEAVMGKEQGWMDHDHRVIARALRPDEVSVLERWNQADPEGRRGFSAGLDAISQSAQPTRAPTKRRA